MLIKNSQLNNETIKVLNDLLEMDIKASVAFKLMRIIKEISSLVEDKVKAERLIFTKYVEMDENNNPVLIYENNKVVEGAFKIKDMKSFKTEMDDLLLVENILNYSKINFEDLGLSTAKIKDLLKIDFIFE